jgi:hypothetical protein
MFFQGKAEALFGIMEKTLSLLQKGYTEEEVSSAIDSFGKSMIKRCFKFCSIFRGLLKMIKMAHACSFQATEQQCRCLRTQFWQGE